MISDEELVGLANSGDGEGFLGLYERYRDWVYRLAWRFTGNDADSQDVVQETFSYLLKKFPGFELRAAMTTFLYPVVKHVAIRVRQKRRGGDLGEEVLEQIPAKGQRERHLEDLATIVRVLGPEQREVLLMRYVDDMTLDEISQALNVPAGTVKSRLYRALEILREDERTRDYFLG